MSDTKKKRSKWPAALAVVLVVGAGAAGGSYYMKSSASSEKESEYKTAVVTEGSICVTTEGSGSVEAASTKAVVLEYDGKLDEIYVEHGDQVKAGDILAIYDTDALDTVIQAKEAELAQINSTISATLKDGSETITSPVAGRVKRIFAAVDDEVQKVVDNNGGLLEISADSRLCVTFAEGAGSLREGDSVTVDFDGFSVTGTVASMEEGNVTVTIPDDTEYKVDTMATVYGDSGLVLGTGELKSNHPYMVQADYGTISQVDVSKTTLVDVGTVLFHRENAKYNREYLDLLSDRETLIDELQELKDYQKNPVVKSEYDGYLVTLDALEGMPYEKDQQLCTIADQGTLNLKVEIDELDIDGVSVGQEASVKFDAFEEDIYPGKVKKISGIGSNIGGVTTYTVTIELNGSAHLKDAMSATADITTASKDQVLLVPVDAIEAVGDARYVQLMNGEEPVQTEITTGLINEEYAEVLTGLSAGDVVVLHDKESVDLFGAMMQQQENMRQTMRNQ